MAKRRVPGYLRHKASGQALVRINGRDFYLGKYDSPESKDEYDRLISKWLHNVGVLLSTLAEDGISVNELCLAYLNYAEGYFRDSDGAVSESIFKTRAAVRYLSEHYGRTDAQDFGPLALLSLRDRMIEKDLSRGYINSLVDIVRQLFKWGVSRQLIPVAVHSSLVTVERLKKGKSEARETEDVKPVDDKIIDATLPELSATFQAMVRLQRLTGMRPGEVCNLRPIDVDRSGEVWFYRPPNHKTAWRDKKRVIPIGPKAQAVLMPYLDREEEAFCFSPREAVQLRNVELRRNRKSKVQPSQRSRKKRKTKRPPGDKYPVRSYCQGIERACKRAGVPKWTPNQLRHTAATMVRATADLDTARTVLGHGSVKTTEIYAEADLKKAAEVAKKIG